MKLAGKSEWTKWEDPASQAGIIQGLGGLDRLKEKAFGAFTEMDLGQAQFCLAWQLLVCRLHNHACRPLAGTQAFQPPTGTHILDFSGSEALGRGRSHIIGIPGSPACT